MGVEVPVNVKVTKEGKTIKLSTKNNWSIIKEAIDSNDSRLVWCMGKQKRKEFYIHLHYTCSRTTPQMSTNLILLSRKEDDIKRRLLFDHRMMTFEKACKTGWRQGNLGTSSSIDLLYKVHSHATCTDPCFGKNTRITHRKHHVHSHGSDTAGTGVGDDTHDVCDTGGKSVSEKSDVCLLRKSDLLIPLKHCLQSNWWNHSLGCLDKTWVNSESGSSLVSSRFEEARRHFSALFRVCLCCPEKLLRKDCVESSTESPPRFDKQSLQWIGLLAWGMSWLLFDRLCSPLESRGFVVHIDAESSAPRAVHAREGKRGNERMLGNV